MTDKLLVTFKDLPKLEGFTIKVPAGTVIHSVQEAWDMIMFEYQWQCDEAPTRTVEIPTRKRYDSKP